MRVFHITWITFFLCFFGWFGIAPLMPIVRDDLGLTRPQIGHIIIASVAITVFARLLFGWLCDRIGPRLSYTILLVIGSLPVMGIGLSNSYESFLLFRLGIGVIGASFVITQFHTSAMFAPNVVGTANAMAAGWGNMGGGVTLMVMPAVCSAFVALGYLEHDAWRYAMILPGASLLLMAFVYYRYTADTPGGDRPSETSSASTGKNTVSVRQVISDRRVWMLFLAYGACFGIEITIDNIATLYFVDTFSLSLGHAGLLAGLFGFMNIFARALGGLVGDKAGKRFGLRGRIVVLGVCLLLEGAGIMVFSSMDSLSWAVVTMLIFALFLKMSNGATYSVVPFINSRAVGVVSGIVGAGGNVGAVLAGFLFTSGAISYSEGLFMIGLAVISISVLALLAALPKAAGKTALPETATEKDQLKPALTEAVVYNNS